MKKLILSLVVAAFITCGCESSESEIKQQARRSTVQVVFNIPVIKVSFTKELEEEKKLDKEYINELLEKKDKEIEDKINEAIEKERELQNADKFESFPTLIDTWYTPVSKTMIPLGAVLGRDDIKLLDRVIIACKTEKTDISEFEKKYEKDVLAISEVANVSPTAAKDIISKLRASGYSVNKEEVSKSADIKLLWFSYGWNASPTELSWFVKVEGTDNNMIIGYEDGVIETTPIPDGKMVHIRAQYYDMRAEFKEKSDKVKELERKIDEMRKERESLQNEIKEKDKELNKDKKEEKRDISTATLYDLMFGTVQLEYLWMLSHGTGVYLGDIQARNEFVGFSWDNLHLTAGQQAGLILTNAHVAVLGLHATVFVSKDKEVMWVVLPGIPSIRSTSKSDNFGSPANILFVNYSPVLSFDYDCALMITTPIKSMKENNAILGNSDNVKSGDTIVSVGNPGLLQKFTTEGVVANTSFSILESIYSAVFLKEIESKPMFNWILHSNFWFDCPIGQGGTSGSGVWATSGKEKGKVVAIHNMGLVDRYSTIMAVSKPSELKLSGYDLGYTHLSEYIKENKNKIIDRSNLRSVSYTMSRESFEKDNKDLFEIFKTDYGINVPCSGLNGAVPINSIKMYLEEMGINYDDYGWGGLSKEHWEN